MYCSCPQRDFTKTQHIFFSVEKSVDTTWTTKCIFIAYVTETLETILLFFLLNEQINKLLYRYCGKDQIVAEQQNKGNGMEMLPQTAVTVNCISSHSTDYKL